MGQMAPSAQWALHDFVRLAGEEGCTLYFEHFLKSGFSALPGRHQQRYPGLRCWGGLDEMKAALADFAGLPVGSRPLIAGRPANLMKLVAKLLCRGGKRVLITDLTWSSYQKILEREARRAAGEIERVQVRGAILRGGLAPNCLRSRFHESSIALTSYAGGIVRLAMPSVPFSINEPGALIQALALIPVRSSTRTPSNSQVLSA